ncbi:MAG: hypothetical protein A3I01_02025 [Betaproteobacteria bacterium RIFCSPLOWO2_02_FULL_65_24]|nr:MAG: hypothetical protein A3I01_02025 [Betaproteobacteria bacterium RIFCSPLOWO2_02_FULL_65_24]
MCLCAVSFAQAQPSGRRFPPPDQGRPMMPPPGKQVDDRRDERQRGGPPPQWQRMSPEERRQLREDIGQHGRDIYRDKGRGGKR